MHKHTNIPVYNVNLSFMIPYISVLFKKGCLFWLNHFLSADVRSEFDIFDTFDTLLPVFYKK